MTRLSLNDEEENMCQMNADATLRTSLELLAYITGLLKTLRYRQTVCYGQYKCTHYHYQKLIKIGSMNFKFL